MLEILKKEYGIDRPEDIGYMMLRLRRLDGTPAAQGIIAISFHSILIVGTSVGITGLSVAIWRGIQKLKQLTSSKHDVMLERQIFKVIVIQALIPLFLCLFPSIINIIFTLLNFDVNLGAVSIFFSAFTTLQKAMDPVVAMVCIGDYNTAVRKLFCRKVSQSTGNFSVSRKLET